MRRFLILMIIAAGLIVLLVPMLPSPWDMLRFFAGRHSNGGPAPYSLQIEAPQEVVSRGEADIEKVSSRVDTGSQQLFIPTIEPSHRTAQVDLEISRLALKDSLGNWIEESLPYSAIANYTIHYSTPKVTEEEGVYSVVIQVSRIDMAAPELTGNVPEKNLSLKNLGGHPDDTAVKAAGSMLISQACSVALGAEVLGEAKFVIESALGDSSSLLKSVVMKEDRPPECVAPTEMADFSQAKEEAITIATLLGRLSEQREVQTEFFYEDDGFLKEDVTLDVRGVATAVFPIDSAPDGLYIEAAHQSDGSIGFFVEAPEALTSLSFEGEGMGAEMKVEGRLPFVTNDERLKKKAMQMAIADMKKMACRAGLPGDLNVAAAAVLRSLDTPVKFFPFSPACDTYE